MITMYTFKEQVLWLVFSAIAVLTIYTGAHAANAVKIMPLGDSITKGTGSAYNWGYREPLYVSLINADYSFDFVGVLGPYSYAHKGLDPLVLETGGRNGVFPKVVTDPGVFKSA